MKSRLIGAALAVIVLVSGSGIAFAQAPQAQASKALELMQSGLALEAKAAAAKKTSLAELQKALPGKTVARFYQVHSRIDMLVDATFAGEAPLVK